MKHILLLTLALSLGYNILEAQSKISPSGRFWLMENAAQTGPKKVKSQNGNNPEQTVSAIVTFTSGHDASSLDLEGIDIVDQRAGMAILRIPVSMLETLAENDAVASVDFGSKKELTMDFARTSANVNNVTSGTGLTEYGENTAFTGKGVITGLMDTGIDPNHINFKDSDGNLRVKRVWNMSGTDGSYDEYSTPADIANFTTDDDGATHATHVAGIMAGGFRERLTKYVKMPQGNSATGFTIPIRAAANPFYGVAYESDIAMAAGILSDENIAEGVLRIVEYAESEGKPAVVNLSLGSTSGPHDGTDALSRYLDALSENAVICISAGNDGSYPIHIGKDLSAGNDSYRTFIGPNPSVNTTTMSGLVDTWASDAGTLKVTLEVYNLNTGTVLTSITSDGTENGIISMCSSDYRGTFTYNAEFNNYFTGYIQMLGQLNRTNNRYNVQIGINAIQSSSDVSLALKVEGTSGQHVDTYGATRLLLTGKNLDGWSEGSAHGSLNDMACAKNVISVGAYTTRNYWGNVASSGSYRYRGAAEPNYPIEGISPFSSYGTTFYGETRPDICAPGAGIVSSYSTPYIAKNISEPDKEFCAKMTNDNRTDYWGSMDGTSMSCPFVSGVVALWLQADPNLKSSDIKRVFAATAKNDEYTATEPDRWGAGKIDALKGVQYVLTQKAAIGTAWEDGDERMVITPVAGGYEVFIAGENEITLTLHDMQGRRVASVRGTDGMATIATDGLAKGIYILNAQTPTARLTRKIAL